MKLFDYFKIFKDMDDVIIDKVNNKLDEVKCIWKFVFNKLKVEVKGGLIIIFIISGISFFNLLSLFSGNIVKIYSI